MLRNNKVTAVLAKTFCVVLLPLYHVVINENCLWNDLPVKIKMYTCLCSPRWVSCYRSWVWGYFAICVDFQHDFLVVPVQPGWFASAPLNCFIVLAVSHFQSTRLLPLKILVFFMFYDPPSFFCLFSAIFLLIKLSGFNCLHNQVLSQQTVQWLVWTGMDSKVNQF